MTNKEYDKQRKTLIKKVSKPIIGNGWYIPPLLGAGSSVNFIEFLELQERQKRKENV